MSSKSRLENIIHALNPAQLPDVRSMPAAKIVILDVKSGQVLSKPPLLRALRELRYYLVRSGSRVDCEGIVCRVKSMTKQECLNLCVNYEARCRRGSEDVVVAALGLGGGITQNFHELLALWVDEFVLEKREQMIDFAMNFDRHQRELSQYIAKRSEKETGLTIEASVTIDGKVIISAAEFVKVDHEVSCKIKDSSDVLIVHHLLLTAEDFGRLHLSKVVDVEEWTKTILDRVSQMIFFDMSYLDILYGRGPAEIKEELRRAVQEIGYSVKQMSVIPDLDPLRWKDGINVDLVDQTFVTMDSRIRIRLDILLSGKIVNLHHTGLAQYLRPQAKDIREDVAAVVSRHVQQVMHTIDPERFYTKFYSSPGMNEQSVKEVLESAIADKLRDAFAFEDVNIILKPLETELSERLAKIQEKVYSIDIEIAPLREKGRQGRVVIRISFDVMGVHEGGWYEFSTKQYETIELYRNALCGFFKEDIEGKLSTIPADLLQFSTIQIAEELKNRVVQSSVRNVRDVFGLEIRVINLMREETDAEKKAGGIRGGVDDDRSETLKILYKMRRELIEKGASKDDPDLVNVEKRIAKTEADGLPKIEKESPRALPEARAAFSFDHYERIGLRKSSNRRQLDERTSEDK